jgi:hypothetical protein
MTSAVEKAPRTEREDDVASELQSLGKSQVHHLHPRVVNNVVTKGRAGWEEQNQCKGKACHRGNPPNQKFCACAESLQVHKCEVHLTGDQAIHNHAASSSKEIGQRRDWDRGLVEFCGPSLSLV